MRRNFIFPFEYSSINASTSNDFIFFAKYLQNAVIYVKRWQSLIHCRNDRYPGTIRKIQDLFVLAMDALTFNRMLNYFLYIDIDNNAWVYAHLVGSDYFENFFSPLLIRAESRLHRGIAIIYYNFISRILI